MMRKIGYNLLFMVGLMMILGMFSAVSANTFSVVSTTEKDELTKIPKNMSMLSVQTDEPMTVYLDGVEVGKTQGNQVRFEYVVTPGNHEVKILNAEGKDFSRTYTFTKKVRNCICLKTNKIVTNRPCPYNISVSGNDRVKEGDLVTFFAQNTPPAGVVGAAALNYIWKVTPESARITSGLGTSSITIDTTGLGDQTIRAEVEVTDGYFDAQCRQRIPATTYVEKTPKDEPTPFEEFDMLVFKAFDDVKFRLDNYAIGLQGRTNGSGYMIIYQGTEKRSPDADKMAKRTLDYLVKVRGIDPSRLTLIQGGQRLQTTIALYFVYPNGTIPIPSPR